MKNLKTIIIEDEPIALKFFQSLISTMAPNIKVMDSASTVESAQMAILRHKPDLIFLDVELSGKTAFDLLNLFPDETFEVVIVTAYDHYAVKSIKKQVLDYILKPIDRNELSQTFERIKHHFADKNSGTNVNPVEENRIRIQTGEKIVWISAAEILYLEADGRYTRIYLSTGKSLFISKSLGDFETKLDPTLFFRIHNHHIVQRDAIIQYDKGRGGHVVLIDGTRLPVSVRKRNFFLEKFRLGESFDLNW